MVALSSNTNKTMDNKPSNAGAATSTDDYLLKKPAATAPHGDASSSSGSSSLSTYLSLIQQYLSVLRLDNASFLAERCLAEYNDSSDAVYMVALCRYRQGKPLSAWRTLEHNNLTTFPPSLVYLKALCLYDLDKPTEAEKTLLRECRANYRKDRDHSEQTDMDQWILQQSPCPVPNGAAGLALLADIYRAQGRNERAATFYRMSLKLDPFLFTSFQSLAEVSSLDENVSPAEIFGVSSKGNSSVDPAVVTGGVTNIPSNTPLQVISTPGAPGPQKLFQSVLRQRVTQPETPNLTPIPVNSSLAPLETPRNPHLQTPMDPVVLRRAKDVASRSYYPPSPDTPVTNVTKTMKYLRGLGPTTSENDSRTSSQKNLFRENTQSNRNSLPPVAPSTAGGATAMTTGPIISTAPAEPQKPERETKVNEILELLSTCGSIYFNVRRYRCKAALAALQSLSPNQQCTGWALHQQGKAYLEMSDFHSARRSLEQMRTVDPGRSQGLELLSTVYWQLKKEVELASLAQRVVHAHRLTPEAWCVMGNCFSLQKDHETALVYFKRSLQIDDKFTYTYTLAGYEYMANEDFEKAETCFRKALFTDPGHYNAWYGLGAISQRQEKYDMAEYNFQKAVEINPYSSVLRCNLGVALFANKKPYQALDALNEAFRMDPNNPQARYQRATIFTALNKNEEALIELQKVRDAAPKEATVHFAMGKVLKKLGRQQEAMKCFLTAMDLDPKDNQAIKSAMDKLDEPDIEEQDMHTF